MTIQEIKSAFHDLVYAERGSGRFKYALNQFYRMLSPFLSFIIVFILILAMLIFMSTEQDQTSRFTDIFVDPVEVEELDETPQIEEIEQLDIDPVDVVDVSFTNIETPRTDVNQTGPVSPKPAPLNAVAMNYKSPVVMRGIYGARMSGQIGEARARNGGDRAGEIAVMRALRWLKTKQNKDGSWSNCKPAMTGMALLCYLAHGEIPGRSPEFGDTVQSGFKYLIDSFSDKTGTFAGHDGNNYAHLIATYAMCEGYSMMQNPSMKEVAEKALVKIVKGQHPNGGWDYKMAQTTRDDTSYMGWAAQAIKAGYIAQTLEVDGLAAAYSNAPAGFKVNYHHDGGFGYTSPSHTSGLTAVGTLCMQLMGKGNDNAVKKSLEVMDDWTLGWIPDKNDINFKAIPSNVGTGVNQQYYAYYATQVMFQSGGKRWEKWNAVMKNLYPRTQKVQTRETSNYVDHLGHPQEIGHWENGDTSKDGGQFVMDTCLACLQMEVYYRYLATYDIVKIEDEDMIMSNVKKDDIQIDIEF